MNEVKICSLFLLDICPFFTPKGHVRQEGRTSRKSSWSAVVSEWLLVLFIYCPVLSNPMESKWSLVGIFCWFFSLSHIYYLIISQKYKTASVLTVHLSHSVRVRCSHHLILHQSLCYLQDGNTWYHHLHSWQRVWLAMNQNLKLRGRLKKSS